VIYVLIQNLVKKYEKIIFKLQLNDDGISAKASDIKTCNATTVIL